METVTFTSIKNDTLIVMIGKNGIVESWGGGGVLSIVINHSSTNEVNVVETFDIRYAIRRVNKSNQNI